MKAKITHINKSIEFIDVVKLDFLLGLIKGSDRVLATSHFVWARIVVPVSFRLYNMKHIHTPNTFIIFDNLLSCSDQGN